jgi:alanine racemase
MILLNFLKKIRRSFFRYTPAVEVLLSKNNLLHNLKVHERHYPNFSFAPVLKSNAYGHGLIQIAQILDNQRVPFFVVDSLYEAIFLKNQGIKSPLLVIGYTSPENIRHNRKREIAFTITSQEQLQEIDKKITSRQTFHLKIDTGMHRQGILIDQIETAIRIIKHNEFIYLEGICSHLADADGDNENFTDLQIKQWNEIVDKFQQNFKNIKFFHLAASAGTYFSDRLKGNIIRLGIGLYGINTSPFSKLDLMPVLQMQSVISSVRNLNPGELIGYNITHKTTRASKIATVPVGYFEGVDRRLSNCGFFKIRDFTCPIVGRVSMNITSIDVTSVPSVQFGETVTMISSSQNDNHSIENIAKLAKTIPYEIMIHIPPHLRRKIIA